MRYLAPGGGTAAFLILVAFVCVTLPPAPAHAQEEIADEGPGMHACPGTYATLALAALSVAATVAGVRAARSAGAWPHWGALARGLGDAGFLVALGYVVFTMRGAVDVIARLGAAITPADLADGVNAALFDLGVGCAAALTGLVGAGLVRLRRSPAQ